MSRIDHFTVVGSVTWPLNGSKAAGDLVLIQTSLLLLCKLSCCQNEKRREVSRSPRALLTFISQVTKHTTVKWPFLAIEYVFDIETFCVDKRGHDYKENEARDYCLFFYSCFEKGCPRAKKSKSIMGNGLRLLD